MAGEVSVPDDVLVSFAVFVRGILMLAVWVRVLCSWCERFQGGSCSLYTFGCVGDDRRVHAHILLP